MEILRHKNQLRNEKKFIFSSSSTNISKFLLMMGAYQKYPSRSINSIYFDTIFHKNYTDAVEGIMSRNKIRIRWYGKIFDTIIKTQFEDKYKINNHNNKIIRSCEDIKINSKFSLKEFNKYIDNIKNNDYELNYYLNNKYPNLLVSYDRLYYEFKNIRITVDSNLKFVNLTKLKYFTSNNLLNLNKNQVLELKYSDQYSDQVINLTKNFQNRLSKFSKYEIGLNETFY